MLCIKFSSLDGWMNGWLDDFHFDALFKLYFSHIRTM